MKIAICDDDEKFLLDLNTLLENILLEMNLKVSIIRFTDGRKLVSYMREYMDVDIIFLDIFMGESNGYEIAEEISKWNARIKIIFLTATTAYAVRGYDIKVARYLIKPIKKEKLYMVLNDMIVSVTKGKDNFIVEKNDSGIYKIFFDEIKYIETYNRNTIIHTIYNNIVSYKNMKQHEERLNQSFIRCHSGFIVNMEFIKEYHVNEIVLIDGNVIWVSKNRRKTFLNSLTKFYGEMV